MRHPIRRRTPRYRQASCQQLLRGISWHWHRPVAPALHRVGSLADQGDPPTTQTASGARETQLRARTPSAGRVWGVVPCCVSGFLCSIV